MKEEVQKMSPATVEKRRAVLINVAYIALVLGAFYLFMKYAFWTVAPFLFAFLVAAALQRPTNFISKKTHIKKGIVSVIAVLLIIALLITIVALTGARVVSEVKGLASTLAEWLKKVPGYVKSWEASLYRFAERLPDGLQSSAEDAIKSFSDKLLLSSEERAAQRAQGGEQNSNINLLSILKTPLSGVWSTAKQIPSILVGVLLFIIAACFMTAGYDGIVGFIKNQLTPQKRRTLSKTKQIVFSSMGKLVKNMPQYKDPALATLKELNLPLEAMFSTLGRHAARALEASFMADMMVKYVDDLIANIRAGDEAAANMEFWEPKTWPKQCKGVGACEAPRGALAHYCVIDNGKIANWQAVVPTTWNASPRDTEGNHGAFEASLIGTKLAKPEEPLEIIRTIHSFDPCLACATHVLDNKGEELVSVKVR